MVRILIVDDEPAIALGLSRVLVARGFEIAGLASSVKMAITSLNEADCDIALLDLNLRGESVEPVARALHRRGRPIIFMSGYSERELPTEFSGVPFLRKPFDADELVAVIQQLLPIGA